MLTRAVQCKEAEGQKRDKRHIVCYEHRADKGYVHERYHAKARVFAQLYYFARENREKAYISEGANHRKNREKAGESFEIKIAEIFFIRRHKNRRYARRGECY